jgi:hypothetical protein
VREYFRFDLLANVTFHLDSSLPGERRKRERCNAVLVGWV